jgi:hypothetical protein
MREVMMSLLLLSVLVTPASAAGDLPLLAVPAVQEGGCPAQHNMTPAVGIGTPQPILVHHYNCRFVLGCGAACECLRHNCEEDCAGNSGCIAQCNAEFGACLNNCF